jgi:hypothetical protein
MGHAPRQLDRQRPGEDPPARLGHRVTHAARQGIAAREAGNVDDPAPPALQEARQEGRRHVDGAAGVDHDVIDDLFGLRAQEILAAIDGRIVDHDRDGADLGGDPGGQIAHLGGLADIAAQGGEPALDTERARLGQMGDIAPDARDMQAPAQQLDRRGAAHPQPGAGHHGDRTPGGGQGAGAGRAVQQDGIGRQIPAHHVCTLRRRVIASATRRALATMVSPGLTPVELGMKLPSTT